MRIGLRTLGFSTAVAGLLGALWRPWVCEMGAPSPLIPLPHSGRGRQLRTFEGTEVDGRFSVGKDGNLVVNEETRRVFDYYLSALGEVSLADVERLVFGEIEQKLAGKAVAQAKELYRRYIRFLREADLDPLPVRVKRLKRDCQSLFQPLEGSVATAAQVDAGCPKGNERKVRAP